MSKVQFNGYEFDSEHEAVFLRSLKDMNGNGSNPGTR